MSLAADTVLAEKPLRGLNTGWLVAGDPAAEAVVILLHGFPDTADCWDFQIDALKRTFRVVAPFVRGAGPSEPANELGRYAPDSVALDVLEILNEVDPTGTRPVYLVGHDLGSVHAWHLAGLLQKRVGGLVIINGLTLEQFARRLSNPRQLVKSWYIGLMQVPFLPEAVLGRFGRRFLRGAYKKGGLSRDRRPDPEAPEDAIVGPLNQYRAFIRATPKAVKNPRRRLECPVLVIFGEDDAFLEPPTKAELARDAGDLTVRILPGNHWLHRQDPEKINKLLLDFFKSPRGPQ